MNKEVVEYLKRTPFYNMSWTIRRNKPALRILVWDEKLGETKVEYLDFPFRPYFFIKLSAYVKDDRIPDAMKAVDYRVKVKLINAETTDGYKLVKIECSSPRQVKFMRDALETDFGIQTFEADIPYRRRVMIDLDLTVAEHKRKLYIDIEVDPRKGFPDPEKADRRILSIACVDNDGYRWFFCGDDEVRNIIEPCLDLMKMYTLICGWNVSLFDLLYLKNRCTNLNVPFNIFQFPHMDVLDCYKVVFKRRVKSYKLVHVAEDEHLSVQKVHDYEIGPSLGDEVWNLFVNNRKLLEEYNMADALIVKELDDKYHLTDVRINIARVCHTLPYEVLSYFVAIDGITLNVAKKRKPRTVFPTRDLKLFSYMKKHPGEKGAGALVIQPVTGVHSPVIVIDFRAMYPRLQRTFNMGVDTYRPDKSGEIKAPFGSFTTQFESISCEVLRTLESTRDYYKAIRDGCLGGTELWFINDRRQWSIKYVQLSYSGIIASRASRYHSKPVWDNIATFGQILLAFAGQEAEKYGFRVLYGDTDGIFLKPPGDMDVWDMDSLVDIGRKMSEHLSKRVAEFCTKIFGVSTMVLELDLDKIFLSLYLPEVKKRYAGIVIWEKSPCFYLHDKGFETRRTDWPGISQLVQRNLFKLILSDASITEIKAFLNKAREELLSGKHDDKIIVRKSLSKRIKDYQSDIPHVRVAKKMLEMGMQVRVGDKIPYVVLGKKKSQVIPAVGELKITQSGYNYIWKKYVMPIVERLGIQFYRKMKLEEFV